MAYTKTGPFVNNSAPGIGAAFLNNVETELLAINSAATDSHITADGAGLLTALGINVNCTPVVVNGSTSGNVALRQPFRGPNYKVVVVNFNSFRNNGGHTQGIVLPAAFLDRSILQCSDLPSNGIAFQKSGVSQSLIDGNGNITTVAKGFLYAEILGGFDTIIIPTGSTNTASGVMLITGW